MKQKLQITAIMVRGATLMLCLLMVFSLTACGKNKKAATADKTPDATASQTADATNSADKGAEEQQDETAQKTDAAATPAPTLAPSTNKTVIKDEAKAPKVYWAIDVAYHLEDCPELKGKEAREITWDMVKEIGLRQCPVCNPPQYENYIENEE